MTARHLIVGLDGADLELVYALGRQRLPQLFALMDRGVFAHQESVKPAATLPNWTTFLTGVGPGRHGVFDFTTRRGYRVKFTAGTTQNSGSIPGVLEVVKSNGRFLVDGALVNPVPVSTCRDLGADTIIAVNVVPNKEITGKTAPSIIQVIMQTIHISNYKIITSSLAGADVVIEPDIGDIGYSDFHRAAECISRGAEAADAAIPAIKEVIARSAGIIPGVE